MAHNSYYSGRDGTVATWPTAGVVGSGDFAWFALNVYQSINGDNGGSWSPAAPIVIGGAGIQFTTVATAFYGITCTGNASVSGTLSANGALTVAGLFTANGAAALNGNVTLGASGTQTLTVNATGTFVGIQVFSSSVSFNGTTSFGASSSFGASVSFNAVSGTFTTGSGVTSTFGGPAIFNNTLTTSGGATLGGVTNATGTINHQGAASFAYAHTTTSGQTLSSYTRYCICKISGGGTVNIVAPTGMSANQAVILELVNQQVSTSVVIYWSATPVYTMTTSVGNSWVKLLWDGTTWNVFTYGGT